MKEELTHFYIEEKTLRILEVSVLEEPVYEGCFGIIYSHETEQSYKVEDKEIIYELKKALVEAHNRLADKINSL